MRVKRFNWILTALLCWCAKTSAASSYVELASTYLAAFQYADIAGYGTVQQQSETSLTIRASSYWAGSYPTNVIEIAGAFEAVEDELPPDFFNGKHIVFFALTNDFKKITPSMVPFSKIIMDDETTITSAGNPCSPSFMPGSLPMWFALPTNDVAHLGFYSNVVHSIVVSRDRARLYTTLRDGLKVDESAEQPYKVMSIHGLWQLLWTASKEELETALNDPQLSMRFRRYSLFQLKRRFGWPEESEVPDP